MPTNWARAGQLQKPGIDALLVETMLAVARQNANIVPFLKVHDANRTCLSTYLRWNYVVVVVQGSRRNVY